MHELSIAGSVVQIVSRHAGGRRVARVELKVGYLRQVVPDALEFAWQVLTEGTALDGTELAIEEVPAIVSCRRCVAETVLSAFPPQCRRCGTFDVDVSGGEELLVDALELEEKEAVGRLP